MIRLYIGPSDLVVVRAPGTYKDIVTSVPKAFCNVSVEFVMFPLIQVYFRPHVTLLLNGREAKFHNHPEMGLPVLNLIVK